MELVAQAALITRLYEQLEDCRLCSLVCTIPALSLSLSHSSIRCNLGRGSHFLPTIITQNMLLQASETDSNKVNLV
jgi:hypothetical protein